MKRYDLFESMVLQFQKAPPPGDLSDKEMGMFAGSRGFFVAVVQDFVSEAGRCGPYLAGRFVGAPWSRFRLAKVEASRNVSRHPLERDPLFWRGVLDQGAQIRVQGTGPESIDYPVIEIKGSSAFLRALVTFVAEDGGGFPDAVRGRVAGSYDRALKLALGGHLSLRGGVVKTLADVVWNFESSGLVDPETYDAVKRIQAWSWSDARRRARLEDHERS
jgi:hypothetical protein